MVPSRACRIVAVAVLVIAFTHSAMAQQSSAAFARAIGNGSTSPTYVLITVINDKVGTRQTICTTASFLLGAIHYQYHLPYTDEGNKKIKAIALASKNQTFHFSQTDALRNLCVNYTPQTLTQVRRQLQKISTPDLVSGLRYKGNLHQIYTKQKGFRQFAAYRDVLAYVLLERGLQPGQSDMTGGLYLTQ